MNGNVFSRIPAKLPQELIEILLTGGDFKLERIVSSGHATPSGQWCDHDTHEWVILLTGRAGVMFEGEARVLEMGPGDYVNIPAHRRHRVEWTDTRENTVWLALHYR